MTATSSLVSSLINQMLAVKPLWNFAKDRARTMMVKRAESLGVPWRETVANLQAQQPRLEANLAAIQDPDLAYPAYYTTSFHAYDEGNLGWRPAMEVEVASKAVHAKIWPEAGATGDARLRQSYHDVLQAQLPTAPQDIVDLGCSTGLSTETLQATFPAARLTGVDLSPYFLAVAQYRQQQKSSQSPAVTEQAATDSADLPIPPSPHASITWHHAAAEATGLPEASYDLVSICLVCHELPQSATRAILEEGRRLLRPGGHLAIMDMNPQSEVMQNLPPFVFTLLKSTEPYLDDYFSLDLIRAFEAAGFETPSVSLNSPRHQTVIGRRA